MSGYWRGRTWRVKVLPAPLCLKRKIERKTAANFLLSPLCVAEKGVAVSQLPDPAAHVRRRPRRPAAARPSSLPQAPAGGLAPSPDASQSAEPSPQSAGSAEPQAHAVSGPEADCRNRKPICARRRKGAGGRQDHDAGYGTDGDHRGPEAAAQSH